MVRPVDNLIVHVGDIKSATTSVQVALAAGRMPVTEDRLFYPTRGLNHNYLEPLFRAGHGIDHPEIHWLRNQMIQSGSRKICILSGERLSVLPPDKLQIAIETTFGDLVETYTVLHYIRPHIDRLLSAYSERIKIGAERRSLHDFLLETAESGRFQQHKRLLRWRSVFGDRYHLHAILPETLISGDAVVDFFHTILGSVPEGWQPPVPTNESLSATGLAQVARMQEQLEAEPAALRHALGYEFAWLYGLESDATISGKIGMTADVAAYVCDSYQADAKALDQDMFGGSELFVPALRAGARRALSGDASPLEIPADTAGEKVSARLLALLQNAPNRLQLARQIRKSRYQRYIEAAIPKAQTLAPSTSIAQRIVGILRG